MSIILKEDGKGDRSFLVDVFEAVRGATPPRVAVHSLETHETVHLDTTLDVFERKRHGGEFKVIPRP